MKRPKDGKHNATATLAGTRRGSREMSTSSNPRKQHYTAVLAANARALGYHNGKRIGKVTALEKQQAAAARAAQAAGGKK